MPAARLVDPQRVAADGRRQDLPGGVRREVGARQPGERVVDPPGAQQQLPAPRHRHDRHRHQHERGGRVAEARAAEDVRGLAEVGAHEDVPERERGDDEADRDADEAAPHGSTENPSRRATSARRRSSVTNGRDAVCASAATCAAASWSASAARNPWTRRSRRAPDRTRSLGSISAQPSASPSRRRSTPSNPSASRRPSRSSRVAAETHSTGVAHHAITSPSRSNTARTASVRCSSTSSGNSAEASQNLSGPYVALR